MNKRPSLEKSRETWFDSRTRLLTERESARLSQLGFGGHFDDGCTRTHTHTHQT